MRIPKVTASPCFEGVTVIGEINALTAHLMNVLWLVGTFTFAIVLGVVTEDIVNHVIVSLLSPHPVLLDQHGLYEVMTFTSLHLL